jgi:hypothetical protein
MSTKKAGLKTDYGIQAVKFRKKHCNEKISTFFRWKIEVNTWSRRILGRKIDIAISVRATGELPNRIGLSLRSFSVIYRRVRSVFLIFELLQSRGLILAKLYNIVYTTF